VQAACTDRPQPSLHRRIGKTACYAFEDKLERRIVALERRLTDLSRGHDSWNALDALETLLEEGDLVCVCWVP